MAVFVTVEGVVEGLGNSEIQKDGTIYSTVKMRLADGKVRNLSDVVVARRCHLEMAQGAQLIILGCELNRKVMVFAVERDGEVVDDVDSVVRAKKALNAVGMGFLVICGVLCWTVVVPFVLLFPSIRALKNGAKMPTEHEMRREMKARLPAAV